MYGILITLGVITSLLISEKLVKQRGLAEDTFWKASFWTILFGIAGARIYHVIDFWEVYSKNPIAIPAIWQGGVGIFGALIGGLLALTFYLKKQNQDVLPWLDVIAVPIPLAQAIGRWGNYFNKEILPYALYESAANLLLFLGTYLIYKKTKQTGITFLSYLIGYSIIRLFLEPIRTDSWIIGSLNIAQAISILLLLSSIYLLTIWKKRKE